MDTAEYSFALQYTNKLILKGTVNVNSSDPVIIKWHVRFTTVHLHTLSEQACVIFF